MSINDVKVYSAFRKEKSFLKGIFFLSKFDKKNEFPLAWN